MRLLFDEMWPAGAAVQLRQRGHDAVAIVERPALRGEPDSVVFATAQAEGRAVVTENVGDYRVLAAQAFQQGAAHHGLIFTSSRRFPRHDRHTLGRLVATLDVLLAAKLDLLNQEHWLM